MTKKYVKASRDTGKWRHDAEVEKQCIKDISHKIKFIMKKSSVKISLHKGNICLAI